MKVTLHIEADSVAELESMAYTALGIDHAAARTGAGYLGNTPPAPASAPAPTPAPASEAPAVVKAPKKEAEAVKPKPAKPDLSSVVGTITPKAAPTPITKAPTLDEIRRAAIAYAKKFGAQHGDDRDTEALLAILSTFKVRRLQDLPTTEYAAFLATIEMAERSLRDDT